MPTTSVICFASVLLKLRLIDDVADELQSDFIAIFFQLRVLSVGMQLFPSGTISILV
jgi:hypothetical protein